MGGFATYKQPDYADNAGLFAKGDALTDFNGAIKAIGAGRRAAAAIHKLIYDIALDLPENVLRPDIAIQNVDHVEAVATSQRPDKIVSRAHMKFSKHARK